MALVDRPRGRPDPRHAVQQLCVSLLRSSPKSAVLQRRNRLRGAVWTTGSVKENGNDASCKNSGILQSCRYVFIIVFTWRLGDLVIWDNASVQHRAAGKETLVPGEPRVMWQMMVAGGRPVAAAGGAKL